MKSTSQLQEINHYQDQDFPVNVYYSDIHSMQPPGRWLRDFHWHNELQFTLVLSGTLTMQVDNLSLPGQAGDLIFVNTSPDSCRHTDVGRRLLCEPQFSLPPSCLFSWKPHGSGLRPALYRRREILRFLYSPGIRMAKRVDRTAQKNNRFISF